MQKAIYPGTFDPVTRGHVALMERGRRLFDELIVAVGRNPDKVPLFTIEERLEMARAAATPFDNVRVEAFDGLVVHYAQSRGAQVLFRGIRTVADFEYEFQMAYTNRTFGGIETVFVTPAPEFAHVNSRLIKQVAAMGGDVGAFVTPEVEERLRAKLGAATSP